MGRHQLALLDQPALIAAVLRDIERAQRRIFVECYIFKDGRLSARLFSRLAAAARRGVRVRVLYDASGSHRLSVQHWRELEAAGAMVRPYGRMAFLGFFRPGIRDHERLVLVDDVAYTGGHAWSDEWLPASDGGRGWTDLSCRIEGPLVRDWASLFEQRWREARAGWPAWFDTGDAYPDVRLLSDGPGGRNLIARAYLTAISGARSRIWIGNAYFMPSRHFKRALFGAARRGVEVRIITPAKSDLPAVRRAARAEFEGWLRRGISLHEYSAAMFHSKYAVIDDDWCTIGSYNVLVTSAHASLEANLIVRDRAFVATVAEHFRRDLSQTRPVAIQRLWRRGLVLRATDRLSRIALLGAARIIKQVNRLAGWLLGGAHPLRRARRRPLPAH